MNVLQVERWSRRARVFAAMATLPMALAACDEPPPPHAMTLMQAADSADGDAQQARAALAGGGVRQQLQIYFGDSLAGHDAAPAPAAPAEP